MTPRVSPSFARGLLLVTLVAFFLTSVLFDRAAALDLIGPDSPDPFGRWAHWYGQRFDPLVADNPLFLRVMSGVSAFVFGPFYLWAARAVWQRSPGLLVPSVAYGWTMVYSMVVHVAVEVWGDLPPPNMAIFTAVYIPYAVLPLGLYRFAKSVAPVRSRAD